jgi:hypothetical protein
MSPNDKKQISQDPENCKALCEVYPQDPWDGNKGCGEEASVETLLRRWDPFFALYVLTKKVVFLYPPPRRVRTLFKILLFWAHLSETPEGQQARETIRETFSALLPLARETKKLLRQQVRPRSPEGKRVLASCVMSEFLLERFESLCRQPIEVMPGQDYGERVCEFVEEVWDEALSKGFEVYEEPQKRTLWKHLGFNLGELARKAIELQREQGVPRLTACKEIANRALKQKRQEDPDVIKKAVEKLASSTGEKPYNITYARAVSNLAEAIRQKIIQDS